MTRKMGHHWSPNRKTMAIGNQGIVIGGEIGSLCTYTSSYRIKGRGALGTHKAETKFNKGKVTNSVKILKVWRDVGGVASSAVGRSCGSDQRSRVQNQEGMARTHPTVNCLEKASSTTFLPPTCPSPTSSPARRPLHGNALAIFPSCPKLRVLYGQAANRHDEAQACLALGPFTLTGGTHVTDLVHCALQPADRHDYKIQCKKIATILVG